MPFSTRAYIHVHVQNKKSKAAMSSWADESEDPPASPRGGGGYGGGGGGGPPRERPRLQVRFDPHFRFHPFGARKRNSGIFLMTGRFFLLLTTTVQHLTHFESPFNYLPSPAASAAEAPLGPGSRRCAKVGRGLGQVQSVRCCKAQGAGVGFEGGGCQARRQPHRQEGRSFAPYQGQYMYDFDEKWCSCRPSRSQYLCRRKDKLLLFYAYILSIFSL